MRHTEKSLMRELRALRREAVRVARHLRKFDPEGACFLSAAIVVQDIEQAMEDITGVTVDTPKDLQKWLLDDFCGR